MLTEAVVSKRRSGNGVGAHWFIRSSPRNSGQYFRRSAQARDACAVSARTPALHMSGKNMRAAGTPRAGAAMPAKFAELDWMRGFDEIIAR